MGVRATPPNMALLGAPAALPYRGDGWTVGDPFQLPGCGCGVSRLAAWVCAPCARAARPAPRRLGDISRSTRAVRLRLNIHAAVSIPPVVLYLPAVLLPR